MTGPPAYLTLTPTADAVGVIEVKRSRFHAVVRRVDSEEEARELVAQQRRTHHDAGHHCSAFLLGPAGEVARWGDDGEPSGTAGQPMLEALRGVPLSDVAAVVVRWFGGTLLGAGGLARAYGGAVSLALETAQLVRREQRTLCEVTLSHAQAGRVEAEIRARGIEVLGTEYAARVTMRIATTTMTQAQDAVAAATSGQSRAEPAGLQWVDVPV
ncbi:IMPACT family protein [Leekyejoonella antrihumi]|uniref:YigZ family protein n=1 Tax=Leekyejoonella antrihumi TaxID=1660198 RepID=A0A563E2V8_9MICO|nr:YigZ family protein [Leekyejoonella antrihumi]TWP36868.1 YigZ family protein [Leekyejoonella antrihumi]